MTFFANRVPSWKALYWPLLWLEAAFVTSLNWDATAMSGLIPYYRNFARIIGSGFSANAGLAGFPTFPMWGYGWLMLLLRSKLTILVFQQGLAMIAVWAVFRIIERSELLSARAQTALRLLVLASPAWFALHAVLWPNSIAASLLPLSLVLIVTRARKENGMKLLVVSGILFGVLLNFRSDYLLLPLAVALLISFFDSFRPRTLRRLGVWLVSIYLMLIPWGFYAYQATGHFLLTSTNGGHVFFIGLGNLPGNSWRIRPDDGDSVMHQALERKFGKPAPSSLNYRSDVFLKEQFFQRVKEHPAEYFRKMAHSGGAMLTKGSYAGELFDADACKPDCQTKFQGGGLPVIRDLPRLFSVSPSEATHAILYLGSELLTRSLLFLSFLVTPFSTWAAMRRRDLFAGTVVITILYHSLLSMAGYFMPVYSSTILLFFMANLVIGASWLLGGGRTQRAHLSGYTKGV